MAGSLNNLGLVVASRGDLLAAEGFYRRALEVKERLAPGSLTAANSLGNLGSVVWNRGDLVAAETADSDAVALVPPTPPGKSGLY